MGSPSKMRERMHQRITRNRWPRGGAAGGTEAGRKPEETTEEKSKAKAYASQGVSLGGND